jgi:CBS domain-containing protein
MNAQEILEEPQLVLHARTAADLMTSDPISISAEATVREAIDLLTIRGFSAAPVIDTAGRPVGVLSRTDLLIHEREISHYIPEKPEYFHRSEQALEPDEGLDSETIVEGYDDTRVGDIMTPVVFAVPPTAPARRAIADMIAWRVHHIFVVDDTGVLIGVISALDVLQDLAG